MADAILRASGIYAIRNTINGKQYIGSAVRLGTRIRKHRSMLSRGVHHSPKLQRAWEKHGADAFEFVVVEEVADPDFLIVREQFWLDETGSVGANGYNICPRAGSILGVKRSPETIDKMRASGLKYRATEETREKLRLSNTGKRATPEKLAKMSALVKSAETIEKLRVASTGRKLSEEAIEKMRASHLGRKRSEETKEKMRLAKLGKKQSPEHVANRMRHIKGKKRTPEDLAKRAAARAANLAAATKAP